MRMLKRFVDVQHNLNFDVRSGTEVLSSSLRIWASLFVAQIVLELYWTRLWESYIQENAIKPPGPKHKRVACQADPVFPPKV